MLLAPILIPNSTLLIPIKLLPLRQLMEQIVQILIQYGDFGMFVAAFLAGSFFPFASEMVMLGLLAAGSEPDGLLMWGTAGNTLGALFNYCVGSLGRDEWITRFAKVTPEKLERGKRWVRHYGAWAGLLAWIPLLGSVITVAMGFLRVKLPYAMLAIGTGKYIRYWVLIQTWLAAR